MALLLNHNGHMEATIEAILSMDNPEVSVATVTNSSTDSAVQQVANSSEVEVVERPRIRKRKPCTLPFDYLRVSFFYTC